MVSLGDCKKRKVGSTHNGSEGSNSEEVGPETYRGVIDNAIRVWSDRTRYTRLTKER